MIINHLNVFVARNVDWHTKIRQMDTDVARIDLISDWVSSRTGYPVRPVPSPTGSSGRTGYQSPSRTGTGCIPNSKGYRLCEMNTYTTSIILSTSLIFKGCSNAAKYCYYCTNCPNPFTPNSPYVSVVQSKTGLCAKQSYSSDPLAPNSRGASGSPQCVVTGCRWILDANGRQVYTCCCTGNYCNGNM
ncbi:unnamed protein product [Adineta ricciae]|uniref:Uncharacterized protein n=1 Tax=Adineta ricciae TaxID=249248 RepID=A0A815CUJ4_ADIRI|nr:unnamed protein product [Adineta ricciae]